jgi:hypothetical protein
MKLVINSNSQNQNQNLIPQRIKDILARMQEMADTTHDSRTISVVYDANMVGVTTGWSNMRVFSIGAPRSPQGWDRKQGWDWSMDHFRTDTSTASWLLCFTE